MRKLWILSAILVSASQVSLAASACVSGSLASYVALGAGGCTIGADTLSNFAILTGITGATAIAPGNVSVAPIGSTTNPGITVTVNASATAGTVLEALFTYSLSGSSFGGSAIALSGSSETGDGAVTGAQNFCVNGSFGPDGVSGCTGTPGSLLTLDGVQNSDATSFVSGSLLNVTDDFTIDGGLAGSATAGTLTNQFSTVPEPSSLLLFGLIFALCLIRRRPIQRMFS